MINENNESNTQIHFRVMPFNPITYHMFRMKTAFHRYEFFDDCVKWTVLWKHVHKSSSYVADHSYDTINVDDMTVEM